MLWFLSPSPPFPPLLLPHTDTHATSHFFSPAYSTKTGTTAISKENDALPPTLPLADAITNGQ